MRVTVPVVLVAAALLVGCGTADDSGAADGTGASDAGEADAAAASDGGADADGWCAALPTDEVEALWGGELDLEDQRERAGRGCAWDVVGAEGEGLFVAPVTPGTLEDLAGTAEPGGALEVERPDLGSQAVLLGGADLLVVREDGDELRVAINALFLGEAFGGEGGEAPAETTTRDAIVELGRLALERTS